MPRNRLKSAFVQVRSLVVSQSMSARSGPGRLLSARSVEVWVEVGGLESIARRPSPESCLACAGYGPPEVDLFEEDSAGAHDDGDWWFGLITGVGICLILWWVVDRHR